MRSTSAGFTLIELLVASLITMIVVGGALAMMGQAQRALRVQPEASDLQQRLRIAVDALRQDLIMAGAGTYAGPAAGPLTYVMAPLMPYRAFGSSADPTRGVYYRSDVVSFLYVPETPAQSRLRTDLPYAGTILELEQPPSCPLATSNQVCGFGVGDRVMVVDESGSWDLFVVVQVVNGQLQVQSRSQPATSAHSAGAVVAGVELGTYYIKSDPISGASQLMRFDGWATDSPVVDDVIELQFQYFGSADPPRLTAPLGNSPGPWTTYGPAPPFGGATQGNWPPGENCTFLVVNGTPVPRLPAMGAGTATPVELPPAVLTDGPWCPDSNSPNRFDADLLRVRQIRIALRLQSALASLRGPAGVLFLRGGTARAGDLFVPDLAVQFDVTPRNMNLAR